MPYARSSKTKRRPTYRRKTASKARKSRSSGHSKPYRSLAVYKPSRPTRQSGRLPFGPSFMARLPYAGQITLSAPASNLSTNHIWLLNSLFDPDNTGFGHQPYQYDQLNLIYQRYRVHGCKVNVTFSDPAHDGLWVGIFIRTGTDTFTTNGAEITHLREIGRTKLRPLNNTGKQVVNFSEYIPISAVFGVSRNEVAIEDNYSAPVQANPPNLAVLEVFSVSTTGVVNACYCSVTFTYYTTLYDRIVQGQS